jgi:tripartite-type tricarboxylate transporter receptor subunit TctC
MISLAFACTAAFAQAQPRFPSRTVEVVVSYAPGGSTDLVARAIAQRFSERLGQSAVVLNRPGAGGTLGANQVARAAPDGHTLYAGFTTEMAVTAQLSKNAKFTIDDFDGIAVTGIIPVMLIGSKSIRANTVGELIEELRNAPGKYTYGGVPAVHPIFSAPGSTASATLMSRTFRIAAAPRASTTFPAAISTCSGAACRR